MKGYAIILGLGLVLAPLTGYAAEKAPKPTAAETQDSFSYVCLEFPDATALANGLTDQVSRGMHPKLDCFPPTDEPCDLGACKEIICHGNSSFQPVGDCN